MPHDRVRIVHVRWRHSLICFDLFELFGPVRGPLFEKRRFFFRGDRRQHKGRYVEIVERKFDGRADFAGALGVGGREALEVEDKIVWGTSDGNLLGGFTLLFTARAAPDLITGEALLGAVGAETVTDIRTAAAWNFDADTVEGLKGCRRKVAGRAPEAGHVLATKKFADDGTLTHRPTHPLNAGNVRLRKAFSSCFFLVSERLSRWM